MLVGERRIDRVRKEEAREYPYAPTGRWIADTGGIHQGEFPSRCAAAEWLTTWRKTDISVMPRMIVERRYCERQSRARAIEARPLQVEPSERTDNDNNAS